MPKYAHCIIVSPYLPFRSSQLPRLMTQWEVDTENGEAENSQRGAHKVGVPPQIWFCLPAFLVGLSSFWKPQRRQAEVFMYFDDTLHCSLSSPQARIQVMPQEPYFSSLQSSKQFDSKEKCYRSASNRAPCLQTFHCRTTQWAARLYAVICRTRFLGRCSCGIWAHSSGSRNEHTPRNRTERPVLPFW